MATVLTSIELTEAQKNEACCQSIAQRIGTGARFTIDYAEVLYRKAPTDEAQKFIHPESYRRAILYNGHYKILSGYPGTCWMYDEVIQKLYRSNLTTNAYCSVTNCESYRCIDLLKTLWDGFYYFHEMVHQSLWPLIFLGFNSRRRQEIDLWSW